MKVLNNQELKEARKYISQMPLGIKQEVKDIYGHQNWKEISSPTTWGKKFKQEYDNKSFPNLKCHGVKTNGNNHELYERI